MLPSDDVAKERQTQACRRLLSSVVALAMRDAVCAPRKPMPPSKDPTPQDRALTAIDFLWSPGGGGYLSVLEIDPGEFRRRFLDRMAEDHDDAQFTAWDKRCFRLNWAWFTKYRDTDHARKVIMREPVGDEGNGTGPR